MSVPSANRALGLRDRQGTLRFPMPKSHKETLIQANEAIARGDFEGFLRHCTEDTVWNFLGDKTLRGKDAVRQWMVETYKERPVFDVRQLIEEGDHLAALGEITLKDGSGRATTSSYCDVWRFEMGQLAELNAFVIARDPV
jgi:ketosteroid isomerase-like protein